VIFINDSKATNADSTEKALAAFDRDIFWIAGGKPKEGGIAALATYFPRVTKAYLIGEARAAFAATLAGHVPFEISETLEQAVAAAARDAGQTDGPEPVVLLSPACASYDQFRSFEHRGQRFKELVAEIGGADGAGGPR
jgi:UDP-N-acetylmuramoylalanine--D-glutamate ligase